MVRNSDTSISALLWLRELIHIATLHTANIAVRLCGVHTDNRSSFEGMDGGCHMWELKLYVLLKALPQVCMENIAQRGMLRDKYSTRESRVLYLS